MTSSTKVSSAVSSRYATALIDLASDAGKIEAVEQDLTDLLAMIRGSEDLGSVINSPSINRVQQGRAIEAIAEKAGFQPLMKNFLGVLVQNRRLSALTAIIESVGVELSKRRGEVTAHVETAQDLSDAQINELQKLLSKSIGSEVTIKAKVEPSILGGMIVTIGSQMVDDSVARKLERLKAAMSMRSNENIDETVNTEKEA